MVLALSVIGIVASIIIGNLTKINVGVIAMAFAFFLGVLGLGMSVNDIVNLWPIRIMFFLVAIALLFGHAIETGTLDLLSQKMIYAMGGNAKLFPWVAFLITGIIDILGAGGSTPGIVAPFLIPMMVQAGLSPVIGAIAICGGAFCFGNQPINGFGGVVSVGLLEPTYGHETSMMIVWEQWGATIITAVLFMIIAYFVLGCHKAKKIEMIEKPPAFAKDQRVTLGIMIVSLCFMFFPTMFSMFFPDIAWLKTLSNLCQPQSVMIVAALICMALRLADQRKIIAAAPWKTIIQICGVCILVGVATKAGLGDWIAGIVGQEGFPLWLIAPIIAVLSGFLTFFSSLTSVVMPLTYAVIPPICAATGLNPIPLLCAVWAGSSSAGMSPYSLAGALIVGSVPDKELQDKLTTQQLIYAVSGVIFGSLLTATGIWNIFPNVTI